MEHGRWGEADTYEIVPVTSPSSTLLPLVNPGRPNLSSVAGNKAEGKDRHLYSSAGLHPEPNSHPQTPTNLPTSTFSRIIKLNLQSQSNTTDNHKTSSWWCGQGMRARQT